MRQTIYLVIRADRTVRAAKRPRLMADEIALKINLDFPATWGKVLTDEVTLTVPDFTPEVKYEQVST